MFSVAGNLFCTGTIDNEISLYRIIGVYGSVKLLFGLKDIVTSKPSFPIPIEKRTLYEPSEAIEKDALIVKLAWSFQTEALPFKVAFPVNLKTPSYPIDVEIAILKLNESL